MDDRADVRLAASHGTAARRLQMSGRGQALLVMNHPAKPGGLPRAGDQSDPANCAARIHQSRRPLRSHRQRGARRTQTRWPARGRGGKRAGRPS